MNDTATLSLPEVRDKIFHYLRWRFPGLSSSDHEDIVQDTFIRLLKLLPDVTDDKCEAPFGQITTISRGIAIDHLRKKGRRQLISLSDETDSQATANSPTSEPFTEAAMNDAWSQTVVRLSPQHRKLAEEYFCNGQTTAEAGKRAGMSTSAAQKAIQRTIRPLLQEAFAQFRGEIPTLGKPQTRQEECA